jgi:hypothetical protein
MKRARSKPDGAPPPPPARTEPGSAPSAPPAAASGSTAAINADLAPNAHKRRRTAPPPPPERSDAAATNAPQPQPPGHAQPPGSSHTLVASDASGYGLPPEIAAALATLPPPGPGDATPKERRALLRGALPARALPAPDELPPASAWGIDQYFPSDAKAVRHAVRLLRVRPPARRRASAGCSARRRAPAAHAPHAL